MGYGDIYSGSCYILIITATNVITGHEVNSQHINSFYLACWRLVDGVVRPFEVEVEVEVVAQFLIIS